MNLMTQFDRTLSFKIPKFNEIRDASIPKKGRSYSFAALKKLSDPNVLYRLPSGFPLMDYYNPPNNCFSLGVGEHEISLKQAEELCTSVIRADLQVNFVYVTPAVNYDKVKRWQSFEGGSEGTKVLGKLPSDTIRLLSRMVQFCMKFKHC
jgi:hypothetical protein